MSLAIECLGLQTARGRLTFFMIASLFIYLLPIDVLSHLSLWQKLDIDAPSIGLTRAYHHVLHGNFEGAWDQNRLIFVVVALGLPIIAKDVYNVVKQLMLRSNHGRTE